MMCLRKGSLKVYTYQSALLVTSPLHGTSPTTIVGLRVRGVVGGAAAVTVMAEASLGTRCRHLHGEGPTVTARVRGDHLTRSPTMCSASLRSHDGCNRYYLFNWEGKSRADCGRVRECERPPRQSAVPVVGHSWRWRRWRRGWWRRQWRRRHRSGRWRRARRPPHGRSAREHADGPLCSRVVAAAVTQKDRSGRWRRRRRQDPRRIGAGRA